LEVLKGPSGSRSSQGAGCSVASGVSRNRWRIERVPVLAPGPPNTLIMNTHGSLRGHDAVARSLFSSVTCFRRRHYRPLGALSASVHPARGVHASLRPSLCQIVIARADAAALPTRGRSDVAQAKRHYHRLTFASRASIWRRRRRREHHPAPPSLFRRCFV